MLVVFMCFMMKFLEFSSGSLIETDRLINPNAGCCKKKRHRRRRGLGVVRGMTTLDELSSSPADCNSNNVDASYASTTSDAEFIQDNCDYQWFPDYGYREVHHRSVLSSCYDEMAKDLDSQLAQVDMEDYSAQDILSTFPTMCCGEMQTERQGEMYASVSGSLLVKLDFESSISPHTSSQDVSSMSLGQSEPLFSPVKEAPLFPTNYSVDSLDCEDQDHLIVTCQANKHNYTIAFHGSTVMEDSKSEINEGNGTKKVSTMAASDAPTTTWSKLRPIPPRQRTRSKTISLPDLAPPNKLSTSFALGQRMKLYDIQNSGSATSESFSGSGENIGNTQKQGNFSLLRMFIAQRNSEAIDNRIKPVRNSNERNSMTDTAWMDEDLSACYEDSLVRDNSGDEPQSSSVERLSTKSVSICSCSFSASINKFNVNNNNSFEREPKRHNVKVGTSGSELSDPTSSSEQTGPTRVIDRKCPIHCIDRSMQTSFTNVIPKEQKSLKEKKPVYVLYPNYTLPDLAFLRKNSLDLDRVLLTPVKYSGGNTPQTPPCSAAPYRMVTKNDVEMLRQKGLSHVMDLTSLTPLLPSEYWSMLAEIPQIKQHSNYRFENTRPLFCTTPTSKDFPPFPDGKTSGCSTGTAPSSGYRGSSTLLNESGGTGNPLYVYNYGSEEKPKNKKKVNEIPENKRYSMFEFNAIDNECDEKEEKGKKRKSFPNQHTFKESEKEVWDDWWKDSKQRPHSPPSTHAQRLDQLIELSGYEQWGAQDIHSLRDQVSKFLCEVGRKCVSFAENGDQQLTPPNSPTYQKYQCHGLGELHLESGSNSRSGTTENKKALIDGVAEAVEKISNADQENISQLILDTLCPSLYALLSDGLKSQLETPFGPIGNSVWQVVEASAQQGPMTRGLNDLVVKLNSEDVLSEGLIKFNAFIFGLLNVRGVDTWISYIRTRESILSKHYLEDSLLLAASKGYSTSRGLTDHLISTLKPLSQYNFSLDLLYETRQLHQSLLQFARIPISPSQNIELTTDSILLKKIVQSIRSNLGNYSSAEFSQTDSKSSRPRSCIDAVLGNDTASTARKRWSGVQVGSKLANAFERLQTDDEFPDSLETGGKSSSEEASEKEADKEDKGRNGKFRSLQRKWELLSGMDTTPDQSPVKVPRSRIPRPVTSPVRPQSSKLPSLVGNQPRRIPIPLSCAKPKVDSGRTKIQRPSRVDSTQEKVITSRPSSLPYRPPGNGAKVQRRAASSSTIRKSDRPAGTRHVVTLTHRLPKDSGHLAFNEGERLRLVLEVDDTWLLCCRGDQKGLVPRSAVI